MRLPILMALLGLLLTQGCALVTVGSVPTAGVSYTILGTAQKTDNAEYDAVLLALMKALTSLDIKTGDPKRTPENGKVVMAEIQAYAGGLTIQIGIERITDRATRVVVDASTQYFVKDAATAGEILTRTTDNLPKKS